MSTPQRPSTTVRRGDPGVGTAPRGPLDASVFGVGYVVAGSVLIQGSAAAVTHAFAALGPFGTSGLRFAFAAVVLLVVVRPRLVGRTPRTWLSIVGMGGAVAGMNVCLYAAIDRIPLGTAVAIEFVGPLVVAVAGSRRGLDVVWVSLAAAGVLLVTGGLTLGSGTGVVFALGAGLSWAFYLVLTRRVGETSDGFDGLALAIAVSAILTSPMALHAAARDPATADLLLVAGVACTGVALPYLLEFAALRRLGVRLVSVLLSLDPALAALIGLLVLHQHLSASQVAGVALVTIASAGAVSTGPPPGPPRAIPVPS